MYFNLLDHFASIFIYEAVPHGYAYNPYTGTCMRKIHHDYSYTDAAAYCETHDTRLAELNTPESFAWIENYYISAGGKS